jgi:hypothetical protein
MTTLNGHSVGLMSFQEGFWPILFPCAVGCCPYLPLRDILQRPAISVANGYSGTPPEKFRSRVKI